MNSPVGYIGIMAPHDQTLYYKVLSKQNVQVGMCKDGQKIKKGEVIKYRYIARAPD